MIVVDASVLAAVVGDGGGSARRIHERFQDARLLAPEFVDLEVASVVRRALVVHDREAIVPGICSSLCTSVDFPDPDGPDTINTRGANARSLLIRCFVPAPAVFQSPL